MVDLVDDQLDINHVQICDEHDEVIHEVEVDDWVYITDDDDDEVLL